MKVVSIAKVLGKVLVTVERKYGILLLLHIHPKIGNVDRGSELQAGVDHTWQDPSIP